MSLIMIIIIIIIFVQVFQPRFLRTSFWSRGATPAGRALLRLGSRHASPSGGDRTWQCLLRRDRLLLDPTAAGSAPLGAFQAACVRALRRRRGPLRAGPVPFSLFF